MRVVSVFLVAVVALLSSAPAFAESLAEKKAVKEAETSLKEGAVNDMLKACGGAVKVSVDWGSFKGAFDSSYAQASAANYCGTVADGIRHVCESGADEKAAVTAKVKEVKCMFKKGQKKFTAEMKGSSLVAHYDWNTANIADETKAFLMNNL